MDINFNDLVVSRMIMHAIEAKSELQDHATVTYEDSLIELNEEVLGVIKTRLIDAAGKNSKAFELEIENSQQDSFFYYCQDLKSKSDPDFIQSSKDIADILADSQKRTNIPGGYIILLDALDEEKSIYIIIKAEPHQALQRVDGQSQISLLKSVFLSPSQKLYKIGILCERLDPSGENPSDRFECWLFDDQFRAESHPAEYFYKDFLGFTIGNNAKIQSQRFYDKTEGFIIDSFDDFQVKSNLLVLKSEFISNQEATITPSEFARTYFPTSGLIDKYLGDIAHELPPSIVKDTALLKNKLLKRKVDFPNNININGPNEGFDNNVQFLTQEDLEDLNFEDSGYTIIKIKGKPYSDE